MGIDAKLFVVGIQPLVILRRTGLGLEIQKLKLPIAAQEQVNFTCQDVAFLLQRNIHFGLDNPLHLLLVLVEVVHHMLEGLLALFWANRTYTAICQMAEVEIEHLPDRGLAEAVPFSIQHAAVDIFDSLVNQGAKEDFGRPGRREVVVPEELILSGTGLVDLQVTGEAESSLQSHSLTETEEQRL